MRISDWSSDVCSSDLISRLRNFRRNHLQAQEKRSLVDRDHLAPAFERLVLDHRAVDDARGVVKRRERPKGPNRRLDCPRPARTIGDIQPHDRASPPLSLISATTLLPFSTLR